MSIGPRGWVVPLLTTAGFSVEERRYFVSSLRRKSDNFCRVFVIGRMQSYITGTFDNVGCLKVRCRELTTDLPD